MGIGVITVLAIGKGVLVVVTNSYDGAQKA